MCGGFGQEIKGVKPSEFVFLAVVKKHSAVPSTDSVCCFTFFSVSSHIRGLRIVGQDEAPEGCSCQGIWPRCCHLFGFPHFQNNKAPVVSISTWFGSSFIGSNEHMWVSECSCTDFEDSDTLDTLGRNQAHHWILMDLGSCRPGAGAKVVDAPTQRCFARRLRCEFP